MNRGLEKTIAVVGQTSSRAASLAGVSGRSGSGSLAHRKVSLLMEMGWLLMSMTVQIYQPGATASMAACGMLAAYIFIFRHRLIQAPHQVWLLTLVIMAGMVGAIGSPFPEDFQDPMHLSCVTLAVVGVFAGEYNRREDVVLVASCLIVLLPVAVLMSITRNNLLADWQQGGRKGVNLQALFLMLAACYAMLLKWPFNLLSLMFFVIGIPVGSRTATLSAIIVPFLYFGRNHSIRRNFWWMIPALSFILLYALIYGESVQLEQLYSGKSDLLENLMVGRYKTDTMIESGVERLRVTQAWLDFLLRKPTLFGHGSSSYGWRLAEYDVPHNGLLHVFNGFGVIAGVIYLYICVALLVKLKRAHRNLPSHVLWAGAFLLSLCVRAFGECQLIVADVHVAGFAITYACGIAIWGLSRFSPKARRLVSP